MIIIDCAYQHTFLGDYSMQKNPHRYDNLLHHKRPAAPAPMDAIKRAAQFAPFAALNGYDDQVKETARLTFDEIHLDEVEISTLDYKLQVLKEHLNEKPEISITYYIPDSESHKGSKKSGGQYMKHTGFIVKFDTNKQTITLDNNLVLPIRRITSIDWDITYET